MNWPWQTQLIHNSWIFKKMQHTFACKGILYARNLIIFDVHLIDYTLTTSVGILKFGFILS